MAEQATVNSVTQVGPEVTPGTGVAATHVWASMYLSDEPKLDTKQYVAQGRLYPASSFRGKGWSELKPVGEADYNDIVYPLSSMFGAATITTPVGSTTARQWLWTPVLKGAALGQTFTIERGTAVQARKYAYTIFDALTLNYSKDEIAIDGHAYGREIATGITLTAAVPELAAQPARGTDTNIYLDTTSGGIGTTQLTRVGSASFSFANYCAPYYGIDKTQTSYSVIVPDQPQVTAKFKVAADAAGMALYNHLTAGDKVYMRFSTVGVLIDGTADYSLIIDCVGYISAPAAFGDDQKIEAIEYTLTIGEDSAWSSGTSMIITVINAIQAL